MALSSDPEARERQLANLRPQAHRSSGAYSIEALTPLTEQHEQALAEDYPALDVRRRAILADRLARIELASGWVRENGLVRSKHGDLFPIAEALERWGRAAEDALTKAEAEQRAAAKDASGSLAAIVAEIEATDAE